MLATTTLDYPNLNAPSVLSVFAGIVITCVALNVLVSYLGDGKFTSLSQANKWIGPITAIILLAAAATLLLCPPPWIYWSSLEFATLGSGAFIGLVLALNAGKDGGSTDDASPTQSALTNLALVADWITKTLLGATLVNVKELVAWMWSGARDASQMLYGKPDAAPVIIAFGVEFFLLGALLALLMVRVYLSSFFNSLPGGGTPGDAGEKPVVTLPPKPIVS